MSSYEKGFSYIPPEIDDKEEDTTKVNKARLKSIVNELWPTVTNRMDDDQIYNKIDEALKQNGGKRKTKRRKMRRKKRTARRRYR